jgi:POT family proton-dependent oligopeptide transporter
LPKETRTVAAAPVRAERGGGYLQTYTLLLGIGLAVTVFRGAYEQVGNTVALWADAGIDRAVGSFTIPMTWFQSLNPLLVILMTPFLLARWRARAEAGREHSPAQKMAIGALVVAAAYLLLAAVSALEPGRASWIWLALFFVIFTAGELYILPTGLGLFARLAPPKLGATTVAAWYLAIFSGSLSAGLVGTLWSSTSQLHAAGRDRHGRRRLPASARSPGPPRRRRARRRAGRFGRRSRRRARRDRRTIAAGLTFLKSGS